MFATRLHPDYLELLFHDPSSANALSLTGARQLAALAREHRRLDRPVVVRSGHPRIFCAGGNLKDHQKLRTRAAGLRANAEIAKHLDAFAAWATPKLAVVEGRAIGGGVEWLARFDVRWATADADFTFAQKHVGLSFGWGGGAAWARWIGEARTRQLLVEGRTLDAAEAARLGLVDRVVAREELDSAVMTWARAVASPINPTLAGWTVRNEARLFRRLWWGAVHRGVLAAFGKRS